MVPARSPRLLFWQLQIVAWLLFIPIATTVASVAFDDWGNIVLTGVIRQIIGFFLTLALWRFYRRWPVETFKLAPHVIPITLACLSATALDALLVEAIRQVLGFSPAPPLLERGALPVRFTLYVAWTALYFLIRRELESHTRGIQLAQAETAAREAELATLRAQVNPHFLFNALTSILAECDDNPRAVRDITCALSDYLRASLLQRDHHAILEEEVDMISGYLRVEKARFEERVIYTFSINNTARAALVPTAVLLPLVENAVKYGMRTSPPPLRIAIDAAIRGRRITLTVKNSGHWIEPHPSATDSTRIGLDNLRRRLLLLHGDKAELNVQHSAQHVLVTIHLPLIEHHSTPTPFRPVPPRLRRPLNQ